jgi:hypothetical protein
LLTVETGTAANATTNDDSAAATRTNQDNETSVTVLDVPDSAHASQITQHKERTTVATSTAAAASELVDHTAATTSDHALEGGFSPQLVLPSPQAKSTVDVNDEDNEDDDEESEQNDSDGDDDVGGGANDDGLKADDGSEIELVGIADGEDGIVLATPDTMQQYAREREQHSVLSNRLVLLRSSAEVCIHVHS